MSKEQRDSVKMRSFLTGTKLKGFDERTLAAAENLFEELEMEDDNQKAWNKLKLEETEGKFSSEKPKRKKEKETIYSIIMEGTKVTVRKAKKKQVKHELDRIKLAEKKKRRLEKALAMSAAIRSELEKKKQKKKEEQERLDEKGARISVAVALHVLLGEDSDDSCNNNINLYKDDDIIVCRGQSLLPFCDLSEYSPLGQMENYWENSNFMVSSGSYVGDFCCYQFFGDDVWGSIGNLTARAETQLSTVSWVFWVVLGSVLPFDFDVSEH
ncbi:Unknown protein [Striga hermonthica]|uniref:Uncharacterized protein n=1 Tax=Striga hermonthica TaxID=68872 RepID=A0A9N7MPI0_STRHE|nr:Unknown protein [Striga hermonthica]